jgi:hypothetical protein
VLDGAGQEVDAGIVGELDELELFNKIRHF